MKKKISKLKDFHIQTFDGISYMNFFTKAKNHKKALERLQGKSFDFKGIKNSSNDLEIRIKQL